MESRQKKRLGDMLIEEQIITDEQLSDALEKKKGTTKRLGEVLVELGYTNETDIAKALSSQLGLEIVSLSGIQIEENVLKLVDVAVLRKYVMVPIGFSPNNMNEVRVAMADPMDMRGIDDFSIITNLQVAPVIATTHDIMLTLDRFYGSSEARKVAEAYALERRQEEQREQEKENDEDIANSPIVLLVNAMIEQAARQRASDIHIEALESRVRIRYRIDGVLYEGKLRHPASECNYSTYQDYWRHGYIRKKKTTGWTNYPCGRPCGIRYPCINPANGLWREVCTSSCTEESTDQG